MRASKGGLACDGSRRFQARGIDVESARCSAGFRECCSAERLSIGARAFSSALDSVAIAV